MSLSIAQESPLTEEARALVAALDALLTELYEPELNHLLSVETLAQPDIAFFVARMDGEAVGCGALRRLGTDREVKRMFVRPDRRGLGVGRAILEALEQAALAEGAARLVLETGTDQREALGLYRSFGFAACPPFGEYEGTEYNLFFEKPL